MPSVWINTRRSRGTKVYVVHWQVVRGGTRVRGSKTCGPFKSNADAFLASKREELFSRAVGVAYHRDNSKWSEFSKSYLEHCRKHKAPRTVRNFDARAIALASVRFGTRSPGSLTSQDIAEWESHLLKTFSPTTARMWLRCLRTSLRWGKNHGFVREVPSFHLPRVESTGKALSGEEVQSLLKASSDLAKPALIFALHTGVRRGELLSLTWDRVKMTEDGHWQAEIGGVGGPSTKTGKSRVIPLHPMAVQSLGEQKNSGRVFSRLNEDISHRVEEAAKKAGLGRVRFHDLRHTWATRYMQATGDLFGLMALGGWSNLGSVKIYQHLTKSRMAGINLVNYSPDCPTK